MLVIPSFGNIHDIQKMSVQRKWFSWTQYVFSLPYLFAAPARAVISVKLIFAQRLRVTDYLEKKPNPTYQSFIFISTQESPPFTHIMLELLALTNI